MRQAHTTFEVRTPGRGLVEITPQVARWLAGTGITTGLLTLFIRHTSASLLIQENADPEVQRDLERFLARLVPDGDPLFEHVSEGADDTAQPTVPLGALRNFVVPVPPLPEQRRIVEKIRQVMALVVELDAQTSRARAAAMALADAVVSELAGQT